MYRSEKFQQLAVKSTKSERKSRLRVQKTIENYRLDDEKQKYIRIWDKLLTLKSGKKSVFELDNRLSSCFVSEFGVWCDKRAQSSK